MTKSDLLQEKLQWILDRAKSAITPHAFFLALVEYIDTIDQEKVLEPVQKTILEQGKAETAQLQEYEKQALVEIRSAYQKISDYVQSRNVVIQSVLTSLDNFKAYEELHRENMHNFTKCLPLNGTQPKTN